MKEAAADLEFEEAGRLRDEIKRLQATELAIADDPFARQEAIAEAAEEAQARKRPRLNEDGTERAPAPLAKPLHRRPPRPTPAVSRPAALNLV